MLTRNGTMPLSGTGAGDGLLSLQPVSSNSEAASRSCRRASGMTVFEIIGTSLQQTLQLKALRHGAHGLGSCGLVCDLVQRRTRGGMLKRVQAGQLAV